MCGEVTCIVSKSPGLEATCPESVSFLIMLYFSTLIIGWLTTSLTGQANER